jgi:hypothetical protein
MDSPTLEKLQTGIDLPHSPALSIQVKLKLCGDFEPVHIRKRLAERIAFLLHDLQDDADCPANACSQARQNQGSLV